jgi:hypothetical protein
MITMTVITDTEGNLVGSIRSDPIPYENTTIRFSPQPHPRYKHYDVEVDEGLLNQPVEHLHRELLSKVRRQR